MNGTQSVNGDRCACGGRFDAQTDGNGSLVDRCLKCNAKRGQGRAAATIVQQPRISAPVLAGKCAVDACPGLLDGAGKCPCCVKRKAYIDAHAPTKPCDICGGMIRVNRRQTMCKLCAKAKAQYGMNVKDQS